ncbi:MAG TPA: ATP-binding protein [Candidatus Limnocylindria bacterium]|nr:ATP-binding protein [Candidatus Limnocylindria bacterium]
MKDKTFRVLLIEDSASDAHLVREALNESLVPSFILTHVTRLDDGLEKLLLDNFDLVVLDLALPDSHGLETFYTVRDHAPEVLIVILTGLVGDDLALRAFQEGAADCLPKSYLFNGELARALHYAIERARIQQTGPRTERKRRNYDHSTPDMFAPVNEGNAVIAPNRDITERKDLAVLKASEVSYRRLFETAQDGILILDAETGRIKDVNPFLVKLLGFSRDKIVGQTVAELSPFRDAVANEAMLAQLQELGYVRYENLPLETHDGRHIAVEFVSNEYQAGDDSVIQCNVRDISQRQRVETKLRQHRQELELRVTARTAELEAVNRELETFSYSVSHDLRAPLRHITGFVDLLHKSAGRSLSETDLHYLTTISEAAERMGELIDNLLAFSRIGRSELQKVDIDLEQLVKEIVSGFALETKGRNITWDIGRLPPVWADSSLLGMVLTNLLSNAVKFTSTRVEAKIEVGCVPNGSGETKIFVRDNGVGFDPAYAAKLFGVFQRLHSTDEFEGTGIGLANVQRIILRHGGKISGKGIVDGGATFSFSLPTRP